MKFRTGDRVKFKDEPGQGVVVKIDKKGFVYVRTPDGFERPVYPEDLMLTGITDSENPLRKKKEETLSSAVVSEINRGYAEEIPDEEETEDLQGQTSPGIYLGVLQKDERFTFYLVNDSGYRLYFTFGRLEEVVRARILEKGTLEEDTKVLLKELMPGAEETIFIQCLFFSNHRFIPRSPCDKQIPFGISSLPRAREFKENPYFDEKAWLIPLLQQPVHDVVFTKKKEKEILKEKGDLPKKKMMLRPGISGPEPVEEVDLHIEAILENHAGMSNGKILEAQLARFEIALVGAMRNKQKKIVFIHGLGNGKLKYEVRKRLDERKIRYQDASFKEYGYGATLVVLK